MNEVIDSLRVLIAWDELVLANPQIHIDESVQRLMDMLSLSLGLFIGIMIGCAVMYFGVEIMVKGKRLRIPKTPVTALALAILVFSMLAHGTASFAQTATPVPLNIPTDVIFTQTNSWMATFAPIAAIGIGISIALAVLGYLGKMIKSAFN